MVCNSLGILLIMRLLFTAWVTLNWFPLSFFKDLFSFWEWWYTKSTVDLLSFLAYAFRLAVQAILLLNFKIWFNQWKPFLEIKELDSVISFLLTSIDFFRLETSAGYLISQMMTFGFILRSWFYLQNYWCLAANPDGLLRAYSKTR